MELRLAERRESKMITVTFNRHAGLVPASTAPHTHRPPVALHGGPRDKPGVTPVEVK
jgi:hypothetical protein